MAEQRSTKAERRAAAKAAAARAAQVKKRNQALAGAGAGLAVVVLLAAVFYIARDGGSGTDVGAPALTTSATAAPQSQPDAATQQPAPPPADFPPVPEGADPALATKPQVQPGTGELAKLTVTPLIKGTGAAAKAGQNITVNYVGVSYTTGQEFDASWTRSEPLSFPLGAGRVIPGWDQGLVGATVGSRVQLDIPAELAYGENPQGGEPPGPLRFVVDVLGVQ
ncbi:FKBP-type peptidyl-prolyl cis-trans isomerase [Phytohabitans kaempferiae]|uniref:Peptidyl-prolyl cis-trans isomerase n=1 Tax=Phytohabitans kaempferiae TaxID=1620943 RepID=A0ABV6LZU1_9ACTN